MAAMRPRKAFALFGLSPLVLASTCRVSPLVPSRDQQQCSLYSTHASSGNFTYRIAASFSGKGTRFNSKKDLYAFDPQGDSVFGSANRRKRPNSGQDALFVGSIGKSSNVAFGVADGVGGWVESGVDPADFSHGLCENMEAIAAKTETGQEAHVRPQDLLQRSYDQIVREETVRAGGSTAVVAIGRENGSLEVANLGDSGFVQLRPNAVYYASEPQTHAFNTPYQLSIIPPEMLARSRAFGGQPLHDFPKDASVTHHTVKHGDVLVFASDGVWDNLSPADILRITSRYMTGFNGWASGEEDNLVVSNELRTLTEDGGLKAQEKTMQSLLAVAITGEAKAVSMDQRRDGPFAREVKKYFPHEDWHGGKVDDICVIVAIAIENE
jgi:protein phosphatase PTC7